MGLQKNNSATEMTQIISHVFFLMLYIIIAYCIISAQHIYITLSLHIYNLIVFVTGFVPVAQHRHATLKSDSPLDSPIISNCTPTQFTCLHTHVCTHKHTMQAHTYVHIYGYTASYILLMETNKTTNTHNIQQNSIMFRREQVTENTDTVYYPLTTNVNHKNTNMHLLPKGVYLKRTHLHHSKIMHLDWEKTLILFALTETRTCDWKKTELLHKVRTCGIQYLDFCVDQYCWS